MSKVRSSKAESANSQKSGGHHQENSKNSNSSVAVEDSTKSGMQVESQESEVKQVILPTKETKNKATSKVMKRNAEVEKKDSQMSTENGVHKLKNKKNENGDHSDKKSDKKSDKQERKNGLTEVIILTDETEDDIKLQIEEENNEDIIKENVEQEKTKSKSNYNDKLSRENKQNEDIINKLSDKEKDQEKSDSEKSTQELETENEENTSTILNDSQTKLDETLNFDDTKDKAEMMNGETSVSEQSFQNMSFGRTLRMITGRRSFGRDNNVSMNSSMFVNTSLMTSFKDEIENKHTQYLSNLDNSLTGLKRKTSDDEYSPQSKRKKIESSSGYSFSPYSIFQILRRPVQDEANTKHTDIEKDAPPEVSKSKCLIM